MTIGQKADETIRKVVLLQKSATQKQKYQRKSRLWGLLRHPCPWKSLTGDAPFSMEGPIHEVADPTLRYDSAFAFTRR